MASIKANKISKEDFKKLNEENIMFITNPGRMGDEDGTTFIVKDNNELTIYRVDGWMYLSKEKRDENFISFDDALKQFPKWKETWDHSEDKEYKGKYKHIYMGFGNGLSIDNSIYKEFEPYLKVEKEEYLKGKSEYEKRVLENAANFNVWGNAVIKMAKEKGYTIK